MPDIVADLTRVSHRAFEVDAVRVRDGEADADIRVVLHLDAEVWDVQGMAQAVARQDAVSIRAVYSLQRDDVITVSDSSTVTASTSWRITGRVPESGDTHIETWNMRKVLP